MHVNKRTSLGTLGLQLATIAMSMLLSGCGACPPKKDPYYQPPAAFRKPTPAQVEGSYRDSWKNAQLTIMNTYNFKKDGSGFFAYDAYEHIDNTAAPTHSSPLRWSFSPTGEIETLISGRPAMVSECAIPSRSTLRWTPDGLYNSKNGRMYPTVGSPTDQAKLNEANEKAIKYSNNYKAVGEIGEAVLTAGIIAAGTQNRVGASNPANALGASMAAAGGGGGIWTALGGGTWMYDDGTLKGMVNQQGYFYGTYTNSNKFSLRNPGTFTPGQGRLAH